MRRIAVTTLAACLALTAVVTGLGLLSAPASAVTQPGLVLTKDSPINKTYPAITRAAPRTAVNSPDPPSCNTAAATSYCDWIPFKVEIPKLGKGDDYYIEVSLTWPKNDASNLDLFLWDDKQTKKDPNNEKEPTDPSYGTDQVTEYTVVVNSTGGAKPERFRVNIPTLVNYNLVVLNYSGANTGYTISARMFVEEYSEPIESTEDEPEATVTESDFEDPEATPTSDDFGAFGTDDGTPANPFGSGLDGVNIPCDPLLCNIGDGNLEEEIAAPIGSSAPTGTGELAAAAPGAGVLILWLVVFPVALAAGGAALLRRRRLSAFSMG